MNSPLQPSHQSAVELNNKPQVNSRYQNPYEEQNMPSQPRLNYRLEPESPQSSREPSPEEHNQMYRLPYLSKNSYGPNSVPNYRKYANLSNSKEISIDHPMRNYLPDQL